MAGASLAAYPKGEKRGGEGRGEGRLCYNVILWGPIHLGAARHLAARHAQELINTCMDARHAAAAAAAAQRLVRVEQ